MSTTEHIRDLALKLSVQERALLARELLDSLDPDQSEESAETAWTTEIEDRAAAYEEGRMAADDFDISLARARQRLHERRST